MVAELIGRSPIGIDIGPRHVHAVQLRRRGRRWTLAAWLSYGRVRPESPVDAEEVQLLAHALQRRGFIGSGAISAVPGQALVTGIVETPAAGQAPRYDIARRELARMHELSPEQVELSWWELPRGVQAKNTAQVMAVGCPYGPAEEYLDALEAGGLDVRALDVRGCALARCAAPVLSEQQQINGILDIGWESATLYMLHRGVIVYDRTIPDGGLRKLYEAIQGNTDFDNETIALLLEDVELEPVVHRDPADRRAPACEAGEIEQKIVTWLEEMAEGLKVPFTYVQHEYSRAEMGRLLVAGCGAQLGGLAGRIGAGLGLEASPLRPSQLISVPSGASLRDNPALAAAIGYAQFREGA